MGLWGGRATGGGTVVVSNPGEATQTASLREAGLLGRTVLGEGETLDG